MRLARWIGWSALRRGIEGGRTDLVFQWPRVSKNRSQVLRTDQAPAPLRSRLRREPRAFGL